MLKLLSVRKADLSRPQLDKKWCFGIVGGVVGHPKAPVFEELEVRLSFLTNNSASEL